jgi:hypothetical protein
VKQTELQHRCDINDIKEFLVNYVTINCKRNIVRQDQQYKISIACFHAWHRQKYGVRASPQCVRTLTLYLTVVAQEQKLQVIKEGGARPKYILFYTLDALP